MADLFADADEWLAGQFRSHLSTSVTYSRTPYSLTILATVGRTAFEVNDDSGGVVEAWESRDYIVSASDLILNAVTTEPARGDRITEEVGGETRIYEVLAPAGQPVWRWSDARRYRMRIHTKLISNT